MDSRVAQHGAGCSDSNIFTSLSSSAVGRLGGWQLAALHNVAQEANVMTGISRADIVEAIKRARCTSHMSVANAWLWLSRYRYFTDDRARFGPRLFVILCGSP